ncbi:MAG: hypothetical protein H7641_11025 [Candidatus Heimdallarchaeota archaeon]|nr:hypothetical protein [Candidatus Heimdallarchaeota archaeon]MCK4878093.1 hypothetical protein [Candidatus Heimdallarchaeota archaeon]
MADDTQLKMELFSALSHPIRRQILELIAKEAYQKYEITTEIDDTIQVFSSC